MPGFEEAATSLAAALNAHTKALTAFVAASGKPGTAAPAGTTKPGTVAAKPAATKPPVKKALTVEAVQERFGTYLKQKDAATREEHIANVTAIKDHYGVDRITNADPSQWPEALEFLAAFERGEDPFADEGTEEGDDAGEALV